MSIMLGDICKFQSGGTPARGKAEYFNGSIPWITTTALTGGQIDANDAVDWITEKAIKESSAKIIPQNSIMVGMRVGVGKVAINTVAMSTNQDIISLLEVDESKWNKDFLCKYLQSKREYLNSQARGATIKGIKIDVLSKLIVPQISLEDQRYISQAIDNVKRIIDFRKQEIRELDELIRARFVEMFGDAVSNPMGWTVKKLKDLTVQINSGNTPKGGSENYVNEGIIFFRSQNVWKDRLEMDDIAYIDAETHASMKRSSLKHGDILMTKTGRINTENSSLGRAALYMGEDDKANVNGHVYFIRLKPEVNNKFILRILVSDEYRDLIRSVCVGGIDKRQLNKEHIEEFPIICPPSDMIDKYVAFAEQVNKSKVEVQKALDETQKLFDSLMQQYFG